MKITNEHFEKMSDILSNAKVDLEKVAKQYELGHFARSDNVKDLQKRFCFDAFYALIPRDFKDELCQYMDDTHIYTALKQLCPKVTKKY